MRDSALSRCAKPRGPQARSKTRTAGSSQFFRGEEPAQRVETFIRGAPLSHVIRPPWIFAFVFVSRKRQNAIHRPQCSRAIVGMKGQLAETQMRRLCERIKSRRALVCAACGGSVRPGRLLAAEEQFRVVLEQSIIAPQR